MKTFKQFNEESQAHQAHFIEAYRDSVGVGLAAKGIEGVARLAKFGFYDVPKFGINKVAVPFAKKVVMPAMNTLDKTYGKGLYAAGAYEGTKSLLQGKPKEALRNYSTMIPGGNMYKKFKKYKNLGRLASTAQSINRYGTKAVDKLDRVIGGTADAITGNKFDFDKRGRPGDKNNNKKK